MRGLVEYCPIAWGEVARNDNGKKVSLDEPLGGFLLAVSRLPLHSRVQFQKLALSTNAQDPVSLSLIPIPFLNFYPI
jgi:hypothetical protein